MIKSLSLSNFKSFGDEQILPFAPLTLIFGRNSSGKSSVIQSLLFLKQSLQYIIEGYPPTFVGDEVDLLSIQHTLHGQGKIGSRKTIKLGVLLSEPHKRPFDLPTTPIGMAFGWTWDHTAGTMSDGVWEVLIDGHNPATFAGIPGQAISMPETFDPSSRYLDASFNSYGNRLSHVHRSNLEQWISLFNQKDMPNLRTLFSELTPVEANRIRPQLSALRWVSPELMRHKENLSLLDQDVTDKFRDWFGLADARSEPAHRDETAKNTIAETDTSTRSFREIDESDIDESDIDEQLGPQFEPQANVLTDEPGNREITAEDIYSEIPSYLKHAADTVETTFDWYTKQFALTHCFSSTNMAEIRIINFTRRYETLGLPVDTDVGDFLHCTPQEWTKGAVESLQKVFESLSHVGPVRDQLQRVYLDAATPTRIHSDVTLSQPRFGLRLKSGPGREEPKASSPAGLREKLRNTVTRELVNRALSQLEIPYEVIISSKPVDALQGVITESILLREINSDIQVGIPDVGYGVGQVIPLIVSLMSLNNQTLVVEQPELHLHPGLQARLGEVIVDACQRFPSGQIIAETHSEHLILRVQRLIRSGKVPSNLISVLYVDQDNLNQVKVTKIGLNDRGEFTVRWPRGFFRERLQEVVS